ncbi:MAG: hypothetical protein RLZZ511_2781 [Cyanobacteriota bacterium]
MARAFLFGSGLDFAGDDVAYLVEVGDGNAGGFVGFGGLDNGFGEEAIDVFAEVRCAGLFRSTAFLGFVALVSGSLLLLALAGEEFVVVAEELADATVGEDTIAVGIPDGKGGEFVYAEAEADDDVGIALVAGLAGTIEGVLDFF